MSTPQLAPSVFVPDWSFADKFRKARVIAGMEQRAFADALDLTASTVAAYETGRSAPRFRDVGALAKKIQLITRIDYRWFLDTGDGSPRHDSNVRQTDYKPAISAPAGELIPAVFGVPRDRARAEGASA